MKVQRVKVEMPDGSSREGWAFDKGKGPGPGFYDALRVRFDDGTVGWVYAYMVYALNVPPPPADPEAVSDAFAVGFAAGTLWVTEMISLRLDGGEASLEIMKSRFDEAEARALGEFLESQEKDD
jgi:hypothetical protein